MAVGRPGVPGWHGAGDDPRRSRAGSPARGSGAVAADWEAAGPVGRSSRLQAVLSRGLAYLLWVAVAAALVLSLINCAGPLAAGPRSAPTDPGSTGAPVPPPGGCAELVVAAWLAGDDDLLAGVPGLPRSGPDERLREATDTYTAAVTPGEGAWAYLIAADVRVRAEPEAPWQPAGLQYFRVTMVPADSGGCSGWSPATLPAQVPAPAVAGDVTVPYPVTLPVSDSELTRTLEAFFAGLLTGDEGLERYVAPGVSVAPVVPPPYQRVEVTDLRSREELPDGMPADGTVVRLLVTVRTDDRQLPLVYPVTVGVRGGRWEIVAVDQLVGTDVLESEQAPGSDGSGGPAGGSDGTADPAGDGTVGAAGPTAGDAGWAAGGGTDQQGASSGGVAGPGPVVTTAEQVDPARNAGTATVAGLSGWADQISPVDRTNGG